MFFMPTTEYWSLGQEANIIPQLSIAEERDRRRAYAIAGQ